MKKHIMSFLVALLVFIVAGGIYIYIRITIDESDRKVLQANLLQEISMYKNGQVKCVNFAKVTPFIWDKLYIFRPYRYPETIDSIMGTFWLDSRFTAISSDDRIDLFVFVRNKKVSQYIEFPRGLADFANADNGKGYSIDQSCFAKDEGDNWVLSANK